MSDPGFTFYADNFLGGTMFMTDAQVGKYVRCLCAQKLNGHLSLDELSSIAKEEKKVLEKFKKDSDGLYFNERLQKEINKRLHHSELQRDRINKRWNKQDTAVLPRKSSGNTCMNTGIGIEIGINTDSEIKEGMQGENKKEQRKIIPPFLEWVKKYCEERKNNIDAEYFVDSYIKNGWMVGKSKMKDWQATIRTWEKNGYNTGRSGTGQRQGGFGKSNAGRPGYDGSGNALGAAAKPGEFDEGIITLEGVPDHR